MKHKLCNAVTTYRCSVASTKTKEITGTSAQFNRDGNKVQKLFLNIHAKQTHTHTHPFNGPFSGTIRYQKGKNNLDFIEARDSEWQWHQLGHMQVCT